MSPIAMGLLRQLSSVTWCSGAALAHVLGCRPAEIRAGLHELELHGLEIVRARGRGYRLAAPYDALDCAEIATHLGVEAPRFRLEVLDGCASTNTLLLERARAGATSGSVLTCEVQSAGRGRRGNQWLSALGGSLTFSLLWRLDGHPQRNGGLSLAAGVAVARALERCGVGAVALKWPNDLLHAGRKLGGILIELQGNAAVIGVGINLRLSPAVRGALDQAATDIATVSGRAPARNRLLATVLLELARVMSRFSDAGFAPLREEWMSRHAHQDRRVTLLLGEGRTVAGRAVGVAEDGALLLLTEQGVERYLNGEISLRLS